MECRLWSGRRVDAESIAFGVSQELFAAGLFPTRCACLLELYSLTRDIRSVTTRSPKFTARDRRWTSALSSLTLV